MPRASPIKQGEKFFNRFIDEVFADIHRDYRATRQPTRRAALDAEMDGLDKIKGRFYHWLTSQDDYRE